MEEKAKKVTITIKPDVLKDLDKLASEWGTTRSGMITILTKLRIDHDYSEELAYLLKEGN